MAQPKKKASKKASKKKAPAKKKTSTKRSRKSKIEPGSRGLAADELAAPDDPQATELCAAVHADGGSVLAVYRDPLGGHVHVLAGLPIDRVAPTPYQRDLSATHVKRLGEAIGQLDRYLDPIVAVRHDDAYWTPNGHHRLSAMRDLGAKSIVALLVPDPKVAYRILALNTEKAHNLKEKSLEVIRMARALADLDPRPEQDFAVEFEEAPLVTLGACYEKRARFAGSSYNPILKRVDHFLADPLPRALEVRDSRASRLLEIDDVVGEIVTELKGKGFDSPYLKAFVVARVNPIRFKKGDAPEFDDVIDQMLEKANAFDVGGVKPEQVARSG